MDKTESWQLNFQPKKSSKSKCLRFCNGLVLNCITLDAQIAKYAASESELCHSHLAHLQEGDLCLFDRYYASFKLMWELQERNVAFCFRMKDNWF